jgi:hypothetical protein
MPLAARPKTNNYDNGHTFYHACDDDTLITCVHCLYRLLKLYEISSKCFEENWQFTFRKPCGVPLFSGRYCIRVSIYGNGLHKFLIMKIAGAVSREYFSVFWGGEDIWRATICLAIMSVFSRHRSMTNKLLNAELYIELSFPVKHHNYQSTNSYISVHNWVYWSYNVATCFGSWSHLQAIY